MNYGLGHDLDDLALCRDISIVTNLLLNYYSTMHRLKLKRYSYWESLGTFSSLSC